VRPTLQEEEDSDVDDLAANMANLNTHDRPAYASPQGAAGLGVGHKRALIVGCSYRWGFSSQSCGQPAQAGSIGLATPAADQRLLPSHCSLALQGHPAE
jgi:hypothetical protein